MTEQLRCTKLITVADGFDTTGRRWYHHERCNQPAAEVKIAGLLTSATAVLCEQHRIAAERECFLTNRGWNLKQHRAKFPKDDGSVLPFRGK